MFNFGTPNTTLLRVALEAASFVATCTSHYALNLTDINFIKYT